MPARRKAERKLVRAIQQSLRGSLRTSRIGCRKRALYQRLPWIQRRTGGQGIDPAGNPASDRILVTDDALIALAGATAGEPGLVVIAGTGSIAFGRNSAGRTARAGGWGYLFGDEGGAFLDRAPGVARCPAVGGRLGRAHGTACHPAGLHDFARVPSEA